MLRPSALKSLLGQANRGGVRATLLINGEGSLIAYAGVEDTEARIEGAIAASIWWVLYSFSYHVDFEGSL